MSSGAEEATRSVAGFYAVEAILGAAYGIHMGVDLALVLAVLPHPEDNAEDLGVFNTANAGRSRSRPSSAPPCWPSAQGRTTPCST